MNGEYLLHCFYPNRCAACGKILLPRRIFCLECAKNIKRLTGKRCGICLCTERYCDCAHTVKWFRACRAPFEYTGSVRRSLIYMKTHRSRALIDFFANEAAAAVKRDFENIEFDCVIPVPMHISRRRARGFNHTEPFARRIAEILGLPVDEKALWVCRKTKCQHTLSFQNRIENVKGIYKTADRVYNYKNALLADDVTTTGVTFNECAKVLRLAGVKNVYCIASAKNIVK